MTRKLEIFKKRLIYRASYRGTKEMDILLTNFVNKYINEFDEPLLKELENSKAQNHDVNELLVKFTILHGELMSAINKARNPAGEKGNAISAAEKKEIFDAFHALENKILKIKTTIEKN